MPTAASLDTPPAPPDRGASPLARYADRRMRLDALLRRLTSQAPGTDTAARAEKLRRAVDGFAANVTLVGQVKAGKTALVNALSGRPDLLPTDVNPWTTVVTSVHTAPRQPEGERSAFTFFDRGEWAALVEDGGRLGEMARRAEAEEELATLRAQVEQMHARAKARLGRNFELLIGGAHRFDRVAPSLTAKYVCFGEEDDPSESGRFADLTRAADLWIDCDFYDAPLILRDTPGVNDPFLVREQTTLRCMRDAHATVVVLGAHQALTSTDLAMLRVISTLPSDRVLLFVNRIDELSDPPAQIAEIERRVRQTLEANRLAGDAPILFGSALWANAALAGTVEALPPASRAALEAMVGDDPRGIAGAAWDASGAPQAIAAMAEAVERGIGAAALDAAADAAQNLAEQLRARSALSASARPGLEEEALTARLAALEAMQQARFKALFQSGWPRLRGELSAVAEAFADSESARLQERFDATKAERTHPWSVDATPLRAGLRDAYMRFAADMQTRMGQSFEAAAGGYRKLWAETLPPDAPTPAIAAPHAPAATPPVAVGAAMSVDLGASWWSGWIGRRRRMQRQLEELRRVLLEDAAPMIRALEVEHVLPFFTEAQERLDWYVMGQRADLLALHRDMREGRGPRLVGTASALEEISTELQALRREGAA